MSRQRSSQPFAKLLLGGVLLLVMLCPAARAQSGTSTVRVNVSDAQGNGVAGATVTLVNVEKNFLRTQTNKESGSFVFTAVPPGTYRLDAEAGGFKKSSLSDVRALVDAPTELDVQLSVGDLREVVNVPSGGGETLINTQDASLGNNFVARQITQLPLESRNVVDLLSLQAGVTRDGAVAGARSDQSNITLDGVDVNEQQEGTAFTPVLRVTPDSVEEFRVTTSNPNASQGRSSGAQVSLVTRSGTNEFHGSLYEFHRNTVTSANDFFNNRAGRFAASDPLVQLGQARGGDARVPRPKLLRNVYGGSVGGALKKNRAFFFYTYEGRRDAREISQVRTVPLASLGRGEVRFVNDAGGVTTLSAAQLNGIFPDVGINPAALAVLADAARRYPANDFDVTGDSRFDRQLNVAGFRFNAPESVELNTHIMRLDFNLTESGSQLLFVRGNYQHDLTRNAPFLPDTLRPESWSHPSGIAVGHTWTLGSKLVNNFRYGLTRLAFTNQGDSSENEISFRFVFQPKEFTRTLSRVTPVHNFTDDLSYTTGNHNFQFGTNIRLIRNRRVDFGKSYDEAITNPSYYEASGRVLDGAITGAGFVVPDSSITSVQNAVAAILGRFSEYRANFNYNLDGTVLPNGAPLERRFATEEYDVYFQDSWKPASTLTINYGLRYGLSRPVYETNGFQVKPNRSLGTFLAERIASAERGRPLNDLIQFELAGPKNDRAGFYEWDKNNFQPRIAAAWSPNFRAGLLGAIFGADGASVLRGGFAVTNDYFGQRLAVTFDQLSTLGFSTQDAIAPNTFNASDAPAPVFTGFNQDIRGLPDIGAPNRFQTPADEDQRIESSLDDTLVSPVNYSWNVSFARKLPLGITVETSYVGRSARNLLATRDVMALNNLRDPQSGMDWYTAAGQLHTLRERDTPLASVAPIPYFQNIFPDLGARLAAAFEDDAFLNLSPTQAVYRLVARDGYNQLDWTLIQAVLDDQSPVLGRNLFFHPQYAAFSAFSTVAYSNYHAGNITVRQRYKNSFSLDFNYTLSHSRDNASGLQNADTFDDSLFILNPLRPDDNYADSDFDVRHVVNVNAVWQLPVGRGRAFLSQLSPAADAVLGGWQLTGISRWNSGLPAPTPFDAAQWATNWNAQSNGVRIRPVRSSPTRGGTLPPNLFDDPVAAYRSFRNARPGETGDRNILRLPGYVALDMGLSKSFGMPWSEAHKLQLRWEVFNVTNTQRLDILAVTRQNFGLTQDSPDGDPAEVFGNFDSIQGAPRVMQFGLRYTF